MPGALVDLPWHPYDQLVACTGNPGGSQGPRSDRQSADPRRTDHTAAAHPRWEAVREIAPAVQPDCPIHERWRLCADLAAAAGFRYDIVRRRLWPA
jgi:hypothetical protein